MATVAGATLVQIFAAVGAAAAVAGTVIQAKASRAQRRQISLKNRLADVKRIRNIRKAIAAARVRRAEVEAAGIQFGVAGGSAVAGATSGITSGLASVLGESNRQFTGQQALAAGQDNIASLQQTIGTFGAISNLATTAANSKLFK